MRYNYKERFNTNNHLSSYLNRKSVLSVGSGQGAKSLDGHHDRRAVRLQHGQPRSERSGPAWTSGEKHATDKPDITRVFVDDEGYILAGGPLCEQGDEMQL